MVILACVQVINLLVFFSYPFCLLSWNGFEPLKYFFFANCHTFKLCQWRALEWHFRRKGFSSWSQCSLGRLLRHRCLIMCPASTCPGPRACSVGFYSGDSLLQCMQFLSTKLPQLQSLLQCPFLWFIVADNPPASNFPQQSSWVLFVLECLWWDTTLWTLFPSILENKFLESSTIVALWQLPAIQWANGVSAPTDLDLCLEDLTLGCSISPYRKCLLFIFSIPILELPLLFPHLFFIILSPCYSI